jgi:hypothetical protein
MIDQPEQHHVEIKLNLPFWFWPMIEAYQLSGQLDTLPEFIERTLKTSLVAEFVES